MISYSGENASMLEFAKKLKTKSVPIISITANKDNSLAHLASESLYVEIPKFNQSDGSSIRRFGKLFYSSGFHYCEIYGLYGKDESS